MCSQVRLLILASVLATVSAISIEPADRIIPETTKVELISRDASNHVTTDEQVLRSEGYDSELLSADMSSGSGACEDYTTSNGTIWHDSEGEQYNCEYYSEGDNCETYGDGYEYDGYTANQACCACAATDAPTSAPTEDPTDTPTVAPTEQPTQHPTVASTDEPTTEPTAECDDSTASNGTVWHDSVDERYTCDWYSQGVNCETYGDQYEYDGYTANQACCACDGSNSTNAPTNSAPTDAEQTKHPTYAPTEAEETKHPTYAPTME